MTVQLTQEQFQELLGRISAIHSSANMNFTQCTLRFHGERDQMKVEEFINAVSAFKQLEQIPDEDALFGLPLLLKDAASTWWAKKRSDVNSWTEALELIRSEFAPKLPPHEVYIQIFAKPQSVNEDIDDFLNGKKQLLGMLPAGRHSEEVLLDFIYGLLKPDLKNEIRRSNVKSFADLRQRVRHLESLARTAKLKSIQPPITKPPKKRCSFCRMKGHTVELCRKRKVRLAEAELKMKTAPTELNSDDTLLRSSEKRMARLIEAELKLKAAAKAEPKMEAPMSPTSTVADSPMSPSVPESPMSPPPPVESPMSPPPSVDSPMSPPPTIDSPMSPTTTDDEEPSIYCFGCGAPNVWRSICAKCKNA